MSKRKKTAADGVAAAAPAPEPAQQSEREELELFVAGILEEYAALSPLELAQVLLERIEEESADEEPEPPVDEPGAMSPEQPLIDGACLGYDPERGWVLTEVRLPADVVERYTTKAHAPNIKTVLTERAADFLWRAGKPTRVPA